MLYWDMKHLNQIEKNVYGLYAVGVFGFALVGLLNLLQNTLL